MDVEDLSYLQYHLDQDPRSSKYRYLHLVILLTSVSLFFFSEIFKKAFAYLDTC